MTTKASNEKNALSREQYKQIRQSKDETSPDEAEKQSGTEGVTPNGKRKRKRIRIRLIPIWLRLIIVALLIVGGVALGAVVGYSVIGDGKASDVFNKETWTHIVDFITK